MAHGIASGAVAAPPVGGRLRNSAGLASRLTPMWAPDVQQHARVRLSCVCPPRRFEFARHPCNCNPVEGAVALTQTQLATAVADRAQLSKADAKRALAALDEVVLEELGSAEKVRIGGLVQLPVRVRPAQKARKGRNPATGEEITIAAKPPSRQAGERGPARAAAGADEGSFAVGAEGASSARCLSKLAVPPDSRLGQVVRSRLPRGRSGDTTVQGPLHPCRLRSRPPDRRRGSSDRTPVGGL